MPLLCGTPTFKGHKFCGECAKIWTKNVFKKMGSRLPRATPSHSNSYTWKQEDIFKTLYSLYCTLKIIHGLFPFTPDVFQPSRHDYNLPLLYQPYAHTNAFQSSFVPSTISIWNHLPYNALIAPSLHTFKLNIAPLFLYNLIIRVHTCISLGGYHRKEKKKIYNFLNPTQLLLYREYSFEMNCL